MSGLFGRFVNEHCAPVVLIISTAEVEETCMKNGGYLFHELLNAASISSNGTGTISNTRIRFERHTEARPKTCRIFENSLARNFVGYPLKNLSSDPNLILSQQQYRPSAWSQDIESLMLRCMSFSEAECTSAPVAIIYAVSTRDIDAMACIQELASLHHTPDCFKNGLYDPNALKLFVLLHDVSDEDATATANLAHLLPKFSTKTFKVLRINSFAIHNNGAADETKSSEQIPLLSLGYRLPLFFPDSAPRANPQYTSNSLLSSQDLSVLSRFCSDLYITTIIPELERKIDYLSKHVSEHRKGVKNVLRSLWRKPSEGGISRAQSFPEGKLQRLEAVRYRFDSSEGQTLLLADTFFILRDHEAAYSTYRLLRDDFKSDNSVYHYSYISIMMAACQCCLDPKYGGKDLSAIIKAFKEVCFHASVVASETSETATSAFCLALIAASICVCPASISVKAPLEAANVLLAAAYFSRHCITSRKKEPGESSFAAPFALITALLTEKAAHCFAQARQCRKYCLYSSVAGYTYNTCIQIPHAMDHAMTLLIGICSIYEKHGWISLEGKMIDSFICILLKSKEGQSRHLLLLILHVLQNYLTSPGVLCLTNQTNKNVSIPLYCPIDWLQFLLSDTTLFVSMKVLSTWRNLNIVQIFQEENNEQNSPVRPHSNNNNSSPNMFDVPAIEVGRVEIEELMLPLFDVAQLSLLLPVNGHTVQLVSVCPDKSEGFIYQEWCKLTTLVELEYSLLQNQSTSASTSSSVRRQIYFNKLAELNDMSKVHRGATSYSCTNQYSIGEYVYLRICLTNPFPTKLNLTEIQGRFKECSGGRIITEYSECSTLTLDGYQSQFIDLRFTPRSLGAYILVGLEWVIGNKLKITNKVEKMGALRQKTLHERSSRARGEDTSLLFDVIESKPLLRVIVELLRDVMYDGEVVQVIITIENEGYAIARDIFLKIDNVLAILQITGTVIKPSLPSYSLFTLPSDIVISPREKISFEASLLFSYHANVESQCFAVLAATKDCMLSPDTNGSYVPSRRYGYYSKQVTVLPSIYAESMTTLFPASTSKLLLHLEFQNRASVGTFHVDGLMSQGAKGVVIESSLKANSIALLDVLPNACVSICLKLSFTSLEVIDNRNNLTEFKTILPLDSACQRDRVEIDLFCMLMEWRQQLAQYQVTRDTELRFDTGAPRTITQVRRERTSMLLHAATNAAAAVHTGNSHQEHDLSSDPSPSMSLEDSLVVLFIPWTLNDRRGFITSTVQLPTRTPAPSLSKLEHTSHPPPAVVFPRIEDAILCKLSHPGHVKWESALKSTNIGVQLEVKSFYHLPVFITIEAVDTIKESEMMALGKQQLVADELRWVGKTSYLEAALLPGECRNVLFTASVRSVGVFDLRRFKIIISNRTDSTIVQQIPPGNHILVVSM